MKVLWVPRYGESVPYNPREHSDVVEKFLYWKDQQVLIAGNNLDHRALYERARFLGVIGMTTNLPDGAGNVIAGLVSGWESAGFGVKTPDDIRSIIQEALGLS